MTNTDREWALKVASAEPLGYAGEIINERHDAFLNAPLEIGTPKIAHKIPGWLRREDAATLYELAHLAQGDIFELGTNRGLSASVLAEALQANGHGAFLHTVELSKQLVAQAHDNLIDFPNIVIHNAAAADWLAAQVAAKRKYSFAFIDHTHTYDGVREAASVLDRLLIPGSFVAFHDFIDVRNFDEKNEEYGVPQGAVDGLASSFEFQGGCGCMGLFRLNV